MNKLVYRATDKSLMAAENKLFFKRWLKSPVQLGTFAPISQKLADLATENMIINNSTTVVEIGAGTGRLTRSLLAKGVNIENLAMVELDNQMCSFLENSLKQIYDPSTDIKVIAGDACNLSQIIPAKWVGKVDYVVSAIPLLNLKEDIREKIIQAAIDVLNPITGSIVHVSYSPISPIKFMEGDVLQKRASSLWANVPPGFVWKFTPKRYLHSLSA